MAKRVGVVLSGCGVFDGSEIQEAVSILIALDKRGAEIRCAAPDIPQLHTINHLTRKPDAAARNVLVESARIARSAIIPLDLLRPSELDAVVFPGGFGAAKNLCTFATDGATCTVNPQVAHLLQDMHAARKPIGFACIAPVLAAAVFGPAGAKPTLTIGTDAATATSLTAMGALHQEKDPTEVCIDHTNRIVTTPCYMTATGPWQVFQGADRLIDELLAMCN
jgi:enhancing lycopene biosynthesis protein 2